MRRNILVVVLSIVSLFAVWAKEETWHTGDMINYTPNYMGIKAAAVGAIYVDTGRAMKGYCIELNGYNTSGQTSVFRYYLRVGDTFTLRYNMTEVTLKVKAIDYNGVTVDSQ